MADNEISTAIGFIAGTVEVNGVPASSQDTVSVFARQDQGSGPNAQINFGIQECKPEAGKKYAITVAPGTWDVWAQVGPAVVSERKIVTVKSGQSVTVDFSFGEDKD